MQLQAILKHNGTKFVIELSGKKVYSAVNKAILIQRFQNDFLTSRIAIKLNINVIPELIDKTAGPSSEGVTVTEATIANEKQAPVQSKYSINERFGFLDSLGNMVLSKTVSSLIVSGGGGLGKTYTIMKMLKNAGLKEDIDYVVVKGFTTPKALYRTLYNDSEKIIVFDDCDSAFKDPQAANLLKAALDSSKIRKVSWGSERLDEELPDNFLFKGLVFFITNVELKKFSQPLRSRAYAVDLSMTFEDKLERMETILEDIAPDYDMSSKRDALDFIIRKGRDMADLNFRTLEKTIAIRAGAGANWEKLAEYTAVEA